MKKLYLLGGILFLMMSGMVLLAQNNLDDRGNPNDPDVNARANACYADASLEGTCNTDWKWVCGWGIIRLEYGLLPRESLSELCQSLLPALPISEMNENNASSNTNISVTSLPAIMTLVPGSTNTPTNTPIVPTNTPTNTPTQTIPAPTDTPTSTPTDIPTSTPTNTPAPPAP